MDTPPPWSGSPATDPSGLTAFPWLLPDVPCCAPEGGARVVTFSGGPLNGLRRALESPPLLLSVPCLGEGPGAPRVATAVYRLDASGRVYSHSSTRP